jgi:hypothetical protein
MLMTVQQRSVLAHHFAAVKTSAHVVASKQQGAHEEVPGYLSRRDPTARGRTVLAKAHVCMVSQTMANNPSV